MTGLLTRLRLAFYGLRGLERRAERAMAGLGTGSFCALILPNRSSGQGSAGLPNDPNAI
jgi:hypothetical protein